MITGRSPRDVNVDCPLIVVEKTVFSPIRGGASRALAQLRAHDFARDVLAEPAALIVGRGWSVVVDVVVVVVRGH